MPGTAITKAKVAHWIRHPRHFATRIRQSLATALRNRPEAEGDALRREISNDGERVSHLQPDKVYMAHLSIYDFATRYAIGKRVLDAGSGSGYGSAYLAEKGAAHVTGIEISQDAVDFSRRFFSHHRNLTFRQMDLSGLRGLRARDFDLIFSSNVLEHVPDVFTFLEKAVPLLRSHGTMLLAVPPIQNSEQHLQSVVDNLNIPYHLNMWTMRQWGHALEQFFEQVQLITHHPTTDAFNPGTTADPYSVGVNDFSFDPMPSYTADLIGTMTAIFVASEPRRQPVKIDRRLIDRSFYVNGPGDGISYDEAGVLNTDVLRPGDTNMGAIAPGTRISQAFVPNRDDLCGVSVLLAAFGQSIAGRFRLTLLDDTGTAARTVEQTLAGITDNSFVPFLFEPVPWSRGRRFTFCFEALEVPDSGITVLTNKAVQGNCTKDGVSYDGAVSFKGCYRDERPTESHVPTKSGSPPFRRTEGAASKSRSPIRILTLERLKKAVKYLLSGNLAFVWTRFRALRAEGAAPPSDLPDLAQSARLFARAVGGKSGAGTPPHQFDIIVPVFDGFEHLQPLLESIVQHTEMPYRLILVDDCSRDERVRPVLRDFADAHPQVMLIPNTENLGFVRSVNVAAKQAQHHFVILNSDVLVPEGWLGRLMQPIVDDAHVASTTPFTNAGTICSFPVPHVDNPLFPGLDLEAVDGAFRRVDPGLAPVTMPTGVGFCMGINLDVWKKIGPFNEAEFGRGYGEENDWCMRAIAAGCRNVMATNLFVYHRHGASFPSAEKQKLMEENLQRLLRLHPGYNDRVQEFVRADPPAPFRAFAGLLLSAEASSRKPALIVDHAIGGGANTYRRNLVEDRLAAGQAVFVLTCEQPARTLKLSVLFKEYEFAFRVAKADDLASLGDHVSFGEIIYNNLVSYPDPLAVVDVICRIKDTTGARLTAYVHDYYSLCPSYTLLDFNGHYCDLPPTEYCQLCLPRNPHKPRPQAGTVVEWRRHWSKVLGRADSIVCFSESSRRLLKRVYADPGLPILVEPHQPQVGRLRKPLTDPRAPLSVAVVGAINFPKGSQMVLDVAAELLKEYPAARITVIGILDRPANVPNITITGPYEPGQLPDLMEDHNVNICFFPSIIPETFSFVLSELMALEMPICGFDIGAPGDRLRTYTRGRLLSRIDPRSAARELVEYHAALAVDSAVSSLRHAGG